MRCLCFLRCGSGCLTLGNRLVGCGLEAVAPAQVRLAARDMPFGADAAVATERFLFLLGGFLGHFLIMDGLNDFDFGEELFARDRLNRSLVADAGHL